MATLKQWQEKYPDAISCQAKTTKGGPLTKKEAMSLANGVAHGAAVLEIVIKKTSTTVVFSKQAKEQGVASVDLLNPSN